MDLLAKPRRRTPAAGGGGAGRGGGGRATGLPARGLDFDDQPGGAGLQVGLGPREAPGGCHKRPALFALAVLEPERSAGAAFRLKIYGESFLLLIGAGESRLASAFSAVDRRSRQSRR
jgi:hypothetical protein